MLTAALLSLPLAAAPRLDLDGHLLAGAGGVADAAPALDLAGKAGLSALAWVGPSIGLGLRLDGGSYGLTTREEPNLFGFAQARVALAERWSAGLDLGSSLVVNQVMCVQAPCPQGVWGERVPFGALELTRQIERGALHLPLAARLELSPETWMLGLDLGVGLRLGR